MKKITLLFFMFLSVFASAQLSEDFEGTTFPPTGWTVVSTNSTATWEQNVTGINGKDAHVTYDFTQDESLISPVFTVPSGVPSLKFKVSLSYYWSITPNNNYDCIVSISTDGGTNWAQIWEESDLGTFANFTPINVSIPLTTYAGQTNVKIKFQYVGDDGADLDIDDIEVAIPPATPPSCATNIVSTPNSNCGNYATSLTWDAAATATGYNLTVGTTTGGTDVVNNVDIGLVTSYVLNSQTAATTYYWTIVPYNEVGSATGCTENTYTTATTPCYCGSVPTSNDGLGITNVQLGTANITNADVNYTNNASTIVDLAQGVNSNVQITFATGYTYDTNIWIDFNNDYDFNDAGELVKTGIASTNANPTTLNASFVMPATAPLGQHRMRIGTADSGQVPPNPCYSGAYGVTIDYTVNIIAASCVPPTATAVIVPACATNEYSIDVNVTALGNGTPSISNGTNSWPITTTGVLNIGPFANGSSQVLTLLHGTDSLCNMNLGTFTYSCPPANDECANVISLTLGGVYATNPVLGNNVAATSSSQAAPTTCGGYMGGDVWYSVIVPASGTLTVETGAPTASAGIDTVVTAYSGTCGSLTQVGCDDDGATEFAVGFSKLSLTALTPASTVYFRVYEYSNNAFGNFMISAYDASLSNDSFDNANFTFYPNPVKDVLNLSYSQKMDAVKVINLLGQEVLAKTIDANQSQIDLSSLQTGTYLVKVTSDNQVKTIKVVKE